MTNYNERLDETIETFTQQMEQSCELFIDKEIDDETYNNGVEEDKANIKQALTSLIKELVTEAKPEVKAHPLGPVTLADCQRGLDHYEANLLKALEEA